MTRFSQRTRRLAPPVLPGGRRGAELFPIGMFVGVLLIGLNLRVPIVGLAPLIERIREDTGMSSAAAGLLSTVPFLCMAVFSFLGTSILARMGAKALIGGCLGLLVVGSLVRAGMPGGTLLIVATLPIGIALALLGIALPSVVKAEFPTRAGGVTGGYTAAQKLGAAGASLLVVPVAGLLGGWRAGVAACAVPAALALPIWWRVASGERGAGGARRRLPRPSRRTLLLAAVFGLQSLMYAGLITWIAASFEDVGWSPAAAATTTAMLMLIGIPASIIIPAFTDGRDRRRWVAGSAALDAAGLIGLALAPTAAPWLWVSLFAIGNGVLFPLTLTLPLDVSESASEVADVVAWTLGLGYLASAMGPVIVGALRDMTGSFALPFALMAGFGIGIILISLFALPPPVASATAKTGP